MKRKGKLIFSRCICGHRVMFNGTDVAMVHNDGSVRYETNIGMVSSAHPYGKSYRDLLPVEILASIEAFSNNIMKEAI